MTAPNSQAPATPHGALARGLLGGWRAPLLRWAPHSDAGLAGLALLAVLTVNGLKLAWPDRRDLVDWLLLNLAIFWLVPLLWWAWRRPPALLAERGGADLPWTRLLLGYMVVAQVPLGGDSANSMADFPVMGFLGYGYFQLAVQVSEVLFFFAFFHPRMVKALGSLGAVPATVLALAAVQATHTDPLSWRVWLDCLSHSMLEVSLFAVVPSLPVIWVFEVLAGTLGETNELQMGMHAAIVPVENALLAAWSFLAYGLTLLPVALWRRRRDLMLLAMVFLVLACAGRLGFGALRDAILPGGAPGVSIGPTHTGRWRGPVISTGVDADGDTRPGDERSGRRRLHGPLEPRTPRLPQAQFL